MTWSERELWRELRSRRFKGYKFRRQHPIVYQQIEKRKYFYVADLYCTSGKAVVELDGKIHEFEDQKKYDEARNVVMTEMGYKILRLQNEELQKMNDALNKLEKFLIE
jgi:very-short-patch-repair endonuclease